jgi:formate dehydrogenase accessory protein FdhD
VTDLLETLITRLDVKSGKATKMNDLVAEERPLHIFINEKQYATIFCSPSDLKEMVIGHLLSEGILKSVEEIEDLDLSVSEAICRVKLKPDVNIKKRQIISRLSYRVIRSACGSPSLFQFSARIPKVKSTMTVRAETVLECVNRLNSTAQVFRKTGGVHVAALYDAEGGRKALAEDVGRHNAVDKVIGAGAIGQVDFGRCFLALSGRLTGDIIFKAARIGLPIVASLAAAIDSGITIAKDAGITLAGFVRGNRMNVYTFPKRILLSN